MLVRFCTEREVTGYVGRDPGTDAYRDTDTGKYGLSLRNGLW